MRADAKKNYGRILEVARGVIAEHGSDASMRDIARRADVGLATLLRHFPTRETLFEALLCTNLDSLTQKAVELELSHCADVALGLWIREWVEFARSYRGVVTMMAGAHTNPASALYASCAAVHATSARLPVECPGRRHGTPRHERGRPLRADDGSRLGGRPAVVRAEGGSSG